MSASSDGLVEKRIAMQAKSIETHYVVSQGNMVLTNSSNLNMAHMELTIDTFVMLFCQCHVRQNWIHPTRHEY